MKTRTRKSQNRPETKREKAIEFSVVVVAALQHEIFQPVAKRMNC
jgi:hypothetical protein